MATVNGSTAADWLNGSSEDDQIYGYDGNDTLLGGVGNDLLVGDAGSDTYLFGVGDGHDLIQEAADGIDLDTVSLAAGIDPSQVSLVRENGDLVIKLASGDDLRVVGQFTGTGIEQIQFANGQAWGPYEIANAVWQLTGTAGNDTLVGHAGSDVFQGQAGDDVLMGGSGNDTYLFGVGDGHDLIQEAANGTDLDTVKLGVGIDPSQVSLVRENGDLVIKLASGDDLRVVGQFTGTGIEQIQFANGQAWGPYEIANATWQLTGTAGNDTLVGHAGSDVFQGQAGDDVLVGGSGNDTYLFGFGDGHDVIQEGPNGADLDTVKLGVGIDPSQVSLVQVGPDLYIKLASGDDLRVVGQYAGTGIEQIQFANGQAWGANEIANATWQVTGTAGNDVLMGHAGADIFQGLAGNDTLVGGAGNDTYLFGVGDGHDLIQEGPNGTDIDTVKLSAGIDPSQVSLLHSGADLVLRLITTGDEVRVAGQFMGYGIEQVQFANGQTWGTYEINTQAGSDLIGTAGNDTLYGSAGGDFLQGLGGDDQLMGNAGSDVYVMAAGSGHDMVRETPNAPGETDTIQIAAGENPAQVALSRATNGADLLIRFTDTGDEMRVVGQYAGTGIERIQFVNGPDWGANEINTASLDMVGSPYNESMYGTPKADFMQGMAGNDTLNGGDGNDMLVGGDGSDTLIGGQGADRFVFSSTVGSDIILDFQPMTDKIAISQSSLRIGNGDRVIDNAVTTYGHGGFDSRAELVVVTGNISGAISTSSASAMIGSSFNAYAVGDKRIFVVDNGMDTGVFLFTSSGQDGAVSATELTLLGTVSGFSYTAVGDYAFTA